jgi:hypothetical protein
MCCDRLILFPILLYTYAQRDGTHKSEKLKIFKKYENKIFVSRNETFSSSKVIFFLRAEADKMTYDEQISRFGPKIFHQAELQSTF